MQEEKEGRIALIGIIVEDLEASRKINEILHQYSDFIVARMGIPYRKNKISILSIVIDAKNSVISALSGKLGNIPQVRVRTMYAPLSNSQINEEP